ncbi:hypothetical protein [Lysobacter gummosus]|uniref:hypothetical protein n=1 Tax=Lysobacter gummosus TaxID=262324 RepID=UPI003627F5CD
MIQGGLAQHRDRIRQASVEHVEAERGDFVLAQRLLQRQALGAGVNQLSLETAQRVVHQNCSKVNSAAITRLPAIRPPSTGSTAPLIMRA